MWHFEEGTLTFTRTLEQGAFRIKFAFSRKDEGLIPVPYQIDFAM